MAIILLYIVQLLLDKTFQEKDWYSKFYPILHYTSVRMYWVDRMQVENFLSQYKEFVFARYGGAEGS